jgi:rRNA pseudouridine-1189 N-methylase Emg1 (Nep1/Mra1 family)
MLEDYTSYQKGIIRRYYHQKDSILCNRLAEIVSEMYLSAEDPKAMKRLWGRASKVLEQLKIPEGQRKILLEKKELQALADLLKEIF